MPSVERDLVPINGSGLWKEPVGYSTPFALFCPQIAADYTVALGSVVPSLLSKEFVSAYLLALALDTAEEPWRKIPGEPGQRLVSCWAGLLKATARTARHLMICEHLRPLPRGRSTGPWRVLPTATHQLWLFYQPRREPLRLNLLFRCQAALQLAGREEDWPAARSTEFVARLLEDHRDVHKLLRFNATDHGGFWAEALHYYWVQLRRDYDAP